MAPNLEKKRTASLGRRLRCRQVIEGRLKVTVTVYKTGRLTYAEGAIRREKTGYLDTGLRQYCSRLN